MAGVSSVQNAQNTQASQQLVQPQKAQQQMQQAAKEVQSHNHTQVAPPKPANPFVGTKINTTA